MAANNAYKSAGTLRTALGIEKGAKGALGSTVQAHHLIPKNVLKTNQLVQDAVGAGFQFNGKTNGRALEQKLHGSHGNYSDFVNGQINAWATKNKGYTPEQAKSFLENGLLPQLNKIVDKAIDSKTSLHELTK